MSFNITSIKVDAAGNYVGQTTTTVGEKTEGGVATFDEAMEFFGINTQEDLAFANWYFDVKDTDRWKALSEQEKSQEGTTALKKIKQDVV